MKDNTKLHIVMFPWLAFGHFIPFLELSKQLAARGHHIYFVSTPRNLQRLPKIPDNLASLITLVSLPMPRIDSLPPDAEATSDVGFEIGADILKQAFDKLEHPLANFLETAPNPFDWIIYDFSSYWLPPIADKLGIKKAFFSIFFARTITVVVGSSNIHYKWTDFCSPPPWIPFPNSSVYLLPHEVIKYFRGTKITSSGVSDRFRFLHSVVSSDLIVIRTCMELEGEYIELIQKIGEKDVLPTGLLPSSLDLGPGDEAWKSIANWLDKQRKGSVVYVAFGSEFELNQEQLTELAFGLELSELPFFWAFRRSSVSSVELPKGFEDRTRDRGMVWTSWVSQLKILSHDCVGGMLNHCGWSSIIEALQFGKPLIMLPLAIDHGFYARFMVEKKVGIEIPKSVEDGSFTRSSVAETIRAVIQCEAGKVYKDEAEKLSAIFSDQKLHGEYINKFSDYLINHKPKGVGLPS